MPFGASHRRDPGEKTGTMVDYRKARRARLLSSLFPGLGHLYSGHFLQFIQRFVFAALLVGATVFFTVLSRTRGGFLWTDLTIPLYSTAPWLSRIMPSSRLETFLNAHGDILLPALAIVFFLAFVLHWYRCRKDAYRLQLRKALRGKILHCREDGTVKFNLGSLRGVEIGMRFLILHPVASKEYSVDKTVSRHRKYLPIAKAEVTKVRNNTSVAKVVLLPSSVAKPSEGDRVEPL